MTTLSRKNPHLLIVGAMHVDEVATISGAHVAHASNPASWHCQAGGVACNAARAAHRVFQQSEAGDITLQTAIGSDAMGETLLKALRCDRLNVEPCIIDGKSTGRYSAIMSKDGELLIGLADVQIAEQLSPLSAVAHIERGGVNLLLIDANLSTECIHTLAEVARSMSVPLAAMCVSPTKATRLLPCASSIDLLFCNRREAFALARESDQIANCQSAFDVGLQTLAAALTEAGFNNLVITDGASDVLVSENGVCNYLPTAPVAITANVNGAGDALAGASVAALSAEIPLLQAVADYGLGMAAQLINGECPPVSLSRRFHYGE